MSLLPHNFLKSLIKMRKHKPKPRAIDPDPRYNDQVVTRFVNMMMYDGKKSTAFGVFYDAMDLVEEKSDEPAIEVFQRALRNVMPTVEVRSRRIGGATFQIPTEIRPDRRMSIAMPVHAVVKDLQINYLQKLQQQQKVKVQQLKNVKTLTVWLNPTEHLHTLETVNRN
jgi:ribosomal protein S7